MKFTKYLVGLAASAGLLFGCQELEMVQICDPSEVIPPVLADVENITITAENQTETAVFTWDAADFGAKAAVNYALEASYGEKEFYEIVSGLSGTKAEISYEILNQNLYNGLELPADTPVEIKLYISARVGESQKHYSEPKTITVQVTAAAKVYPKLFIVGSYNGWSHDRNQYVFDFDGNDAVYSGIIDFGADHASNEFKITAGAWGKDEHSMVDGQTPEGANTELVVGGGANINVYQAKRYYQFSFLREGPALKLNFALNSLGISGDFNGWSWTEMAFDFATQRFYADIEIPAESGLKFRECAENWDQNWGTSTPDVASKKGVLDGGENIKVPAGNYRMYLNMNNPAELVWELNADDFGAAAPEEPTPDVPAAPALEGWGVVGEFTEWADGKDIMMTETAGLLVAKNVTIEAGKQFKIRKDGKWDDNRGAEGDVEPFAVTIGIALKVVIVLTAVIVLGVPQASIVALLGSCGLAIGLALQGGLSNIAGGVIIMFCKPFHVGDYVESGDVSGVFNSDRGFSVVLKVLHHLASDAAGGEGVGQAAGLGGQEGGGQADGESHDQRKSSDHEQRLFTSCFHSHASTSSSFFAGKATTALPFALSLLTTQSSPASHLSLLGSP